MTLKELNLIKRVFNWHTSEYTAYPNQSEVREVEFILNREIRLREIDPRNGKSMVDVNGNLMDKD